MKLACKPSPPIFRYASPTVRRNIPNTGPSVPASSPSVGGTRQPGTTCLIEDIAFHIEDLPEATAELQQLIARHGYNDACIYGHALEGNYHFIINQSFSTQAEVKRYEDLMNDIKTLVVDKYDGSLKAEHGTGRNMAPFVRHEWGDDAYKAMKAVKELFDPQGLLNPGVIFNDDPQCHIKNFKPLPLLVMSDKRQATSLVADKCIECGFCEVNCLSCGFTLSSRQRIVLQREISRLKQSGEDPTRLALLEKQYATPGQPDLCRRRPLLHVVPDGYQYGRPYPYNPPGSITQRQSGIQSRRLCRQSFRWCQECTASRIVLSQLRTFTIRDKGDERHYQGAAQCIRHTSMDAGYAENVISYKLRSYKLQALCSIIAQALVARSSW